MNIIQITLRADYGGGPEHVYQLLKHHNSNTSFYVACPKEEPYWKRYGSVVQAEICELPHRKFTFSALFKLIKYIQQHKINLIHTQGMGAGVYGRLASFLTKVPCIHTAHGIHVLQYGTIKKIIYKIYENITAYSVKHICFVSNSEKQQAKAIGLWNKIPNSVIPNGVEIVASEQRLAWRNQIRSKLDIPEQQVVIAMLSRFDYPKNMQEAYHIAKQCPEFIFLWIGDGEDKSILEQQAKSENVKNIIFMGFTQQPKHYLAASDLYLSTSRWEGMPLGVLEAMSLGLPVVASDVRGNSDVVFNGETGFRYPLGEISMAKTYLEKIMQDKEFHNKLSKKSIKIQPEMFSVQNMARQILDVYRGILND